MDKTFNLLCQCLQSAVLFICGHGNRSTIKESVTSVAFFFYQKMNVVLYLSLTLKKKGILKKKKTVIIPY